jgi:hypothetical protein
VGGWVGLGVKEGVGSRRRLTRARSRHADVLPPCCPADLSNVVGIATSALCMTTGNREAVVADALRCLSSASARAATDPAISLNTAVGSVSALLSDRGLSATVVRAVFPLAFSRAGSMSP